VLTADLRWVEAGSVEEGDTLVGFDEVAPPNARRRYRTATVEAVAPLVLPCYDLTFDDGTQVRASYDHKWLVRDSSGINRWRDTEALIADDSRGSEVAKPLVV